MFLTNIFVYAIIIFGFIITFLISYHSNKGIFGQDIEYISTFLTAEGIYHRIDSIFTKPINISLTIANDNLLKSFLAEEEQEANNPVFLQTMQNYLHAYKEKYHYDSVFLVSTKTNRYYHFNGIDRMITPNNPENDWYYAFLGNKQEYALNINNDEAANNEITVFINCKIEDDAGNMIGVVGVGFQVDYLQEIFQQYEKDFGIKAFLVDQQGTIQISTQQTGYQKTDLFSICPYPQFKKQILNGQGGEQSFWASANGWNGYLVTHHVPNLNWYLIIENDTSALSAALNKQFYIGVMIIIFVIILVLFTITSIIRKYNAQIVRLTVAEEKNIMLFSRPKQKKITKISMKLTLPITGLPPKQQNNISLA